MKQNVPEDTLEAIWDIFFVIEYSLLFLVFIAFLNEFFLCLSN